jgi:hypothetical protein
MKTHSIDWAARIASGSRFSLDTATLNRVFCLAARAFVALVPAMAIVTLAALATTMSSLAVVLEASVWAAGFIFLALAIDSSRESVGMLLATGAILPILALLSSRVAVEFVIVAAAILAVWVARWIFQRQINS